MFSAIFLPSPEQQGTNLAEYLYHFMDWKDLLKLGLTRKAIFANLFFRTTPVFKGYIKLFKSQTAICSDRTEAKAWSKKINPPAPRKYVIRGYPTKLLKRKNKFRYIMKKCRSNEFFAVHAYGNVQHRYERTWSRLANACYRQECPYLRTKNKRYCKDCIENTPLSQLKYL
jgi:hypothetical protein